MSEQRLICRKGFGFVLCVKNAATLHIPATEAFICKCPEWADMSAKIKLAEELFGCSCEYENFSTEDRLQKQTSSTFDHPFFHKSPAMASLEKIMKPKPDHVRACLMEIALYMLRSGVNAPDPK